MGMKLFVGVLLGTIAGGSACYFPVEMQGEFMTQWLGGGGEISYTSLSILYNSIPGWGACHTRRGSRVVLRQGEHCFRCLSLVQRSPSVQQLHTREVGQCHPTEELALDSCPSEAEVRGRQVTEMMLYKTRSFYGEAAAGGQHCPITGRHTVEERCEGGEGGGGGETGGCPSESRLSLRLEGCSRDRERRMELQCLGHWQGEDGQQYLALLDTELPQLGEEPRPRYRCAIYHRQGDLTHLALSNDSTCVHQLERHDRGAEVFTLRREERRRPRSRGQRLPGWSQGAWEEVVVEGAGLSYREKQLKRTVHLRALARPASSRFVVSLETDCGEVEGYTCLDLQQRTSSVMEFKVGQVVASVREASVLCAMELSSPWITVGRPGQGEACPLPGTFTGTIPDSGNGLCATSTTSCTSPDTMTYTVFSCSNKTEVYEERQYQCRGQFTEDGLTYTLTKRLDLPLQECFVGVAGQEGASHRVLEAGAHCTRGHLPALKGMLMQRVENECQEVKEEEEVVIHNLPPRIHRHHPIYSRTEEENEMRVLDIQIIQNSSARSYSSFSGLIIWLVLLTLY